ncbi:uncharacterized protein LOC110683902 [Chenopodium quinoa]|uniref:uncharacterized protein LOC110683902 n=1 Tax=Chenopodium quinoa TaxID=63459 RepID=UPI000B78A370|nr:uncharacterized protein LOC110683902 [Chenopodium quinoa]
MTSNFTSNMAEKGQFDHENSSRARFFMLQPKWKLFLWNLFHNGLAVKSELQRRGVPIQDVSCDQCSTQQEDFNHLFRDCTIARTAWRSGALGIHSELHGHLSLSDWIQDYIRLFISQDGLFSPSISTFVGTLWGLLLFRNNRVFNPDTSVTRPFDLELVDILHSHTIYMDVDTGRELSLSPADLPGLPPPGFHVAHLGHNHSSSSFLTIQVDGFWFKDTQQARMGWCLDNTDPLDDRIVGGSNFGFCSSSLHSEALACYYALQWALNAGIQSFHLFTYSYNLVTLLRGDGRGDIRYLWLVQRIQRVGSTFHQCSIYKADRARVHRAHQIAGEAAVHLICFSSNLF